MEEEYFEHYGSFNTEVEGCFLSINPEMYPNDEDIAPTGRYFVYCIDPRHGSFHFIVEQDHNRRWRSDHNLPFLHNNFITIIGHRIETSIR